EARVEPGAFTRAAGRLDRNAPGAAKLAEVGRLYAAWRKELARLGFLPAAEMVAESARHASSSPLLAAAPACLVYGFYELTRSQRELLLAVASCRPTTLFFPWEARP